MSKPLAKDRVLDLLIEKASYDEKFETYYTFIGQKDIAEALDIVPMTVNRSVKKLQEEGKIDYVTKSGRHKSGHVVTFNMENIQVDPDNPLTGKSVKAEEIYKEYFEPVKYVPKRRYRTKQQIAEDELKKTEEQKRNDRLNDELEGHAFVPKSFFRKLRHPEAAYKGYMLSRLYNAMLVSFAEDWKNSAEKFKNKAYYDRAKYYYSKYRNYDIIGKRFVGTTTFKKFTELSLVLEKLDVDPEDYLAVHINRMYYRLKKGQGAHPPHINNLSSEGGYVIYQEQAQYKRNFDKDHPYYATPGSIVRVHKNYPIIGAIKSELRQGLDNDVEYFAEKFSDKYLEEEIVKLKEFNLHNEPRTDAILLAYDSIKNDKNYATLEEEEKINLDKYLQRNVGIYMDSFRVMSEYLKYFTPTLRYLSDKLHAAPSKDNRRGYFVDIGNFTQDKNPSILEGRDAIEHGYKLYFSLKGSNTFLPAIRTMTDEKDSGLDYVKVRKALSKLESQVPVTESGLIDINVLLDELSKVNDIVQDNLNIKERVKIEDTLEFFDHYEVDSDNSYWYELYEPQGQLGKHPRDGRI